MDVTDNPVVKALLKKVVRNGQKVIAFLKGTMLSICCATSRALLFLYDLTRVPLEWLGRWWGSAFDWVVRHAGDGRSAGRSKPRMIGREDRPGQDESVQALEEGFHVATEAGCSPRAVPVPPAFEQHQCNSLLETSTTGVICHVVASQKDHVHKVTAVPSTTASKVLPGSLVSHAFEHPANGSIGGGGTCSSRSNDQERMLFRLGEGEEEEASSFVPTSISGNRASRPIKWSLGYLEANAEEEGGKVIGGGSFAKVARVTHQSSGVRMAVKAISRYTAADDSLDEFIEMELKTLQASGVHPNVVDCFGFIRTTFSVYVMMPMVATDLEEVMLKVGGLGEPMTKKYMQQVVSAVEYLHGNGILHRDLKPANLLLTEDETILLADFGIATFMPQGQTSFRDLACGTKSYMSPEQVTGGEEVDFSRKVDTWALGIVAYELLHFRTPFRPVSSTISTAGEEAKGSTTGSSVQMQGIELQYDDIVDMQERDNISSGALTFDDHLVSADAKDFISQLLERDIEKRLSAADAAEHPWLGGLEKATEIRANAADAVAAREAEMAAGKARLAGGRRRVVRRRVSAAGV
eukprot:jgi/Undpi1/3125/HiC_scaffold_15.g06499.m1